MSGSGRFWARVDGLLEQLDLTAGVESLRTQIVMLTLEHHLSWEQMLTLADEIERRTGLSLHDGRPPGGGPPDGNGTL